ncbi:helix-turn-helix domain-containing protein [Enterobacter chuandaensis]|uniref:helix-turn-helix domain-containing protein n=1 Tax=Enterobacter chuandaensis TaxID=2497875 RepID=UPI00300CA189
MTPPTELFGSILQGDSLSGEKVAPRPEKAIAALFRLLIPAATPEMTVVRGCVSNTSHLCLIHKGDFDIIRLSDNLRLGAGRGAAIIGLMGLFGLKHSHCLQPLSAVSYSMVPLERAWSLIEEGNAWCSVAEILAYYLRRSVLRDEKMVVPTTYQKVCYRLQEYLKYREHYVRNNIGIVNYILSSTFISRSQVYKIVMELARGGYIEITDGKLMAIHRLPGRF